MSDEKQGENAVDQFLNYSIRVDSHLRKRLDQYIFLVGRLRDEKITREKFIQKAIENKIKRDKSQLLTSISPEKRVSFRVRKSVADEVMSLVNLLKKIRPSASKKDWFVESILEQLEEDEKAVLGKIEDDLPFSKDVFEQTLFDHT